MTVTDIREAVQQVVDDIYQYNLMEREISEKRTCDWLIDPVLESLGWDLKNRNHVALEFYYKSSRRKKGRKIDYVFFDEATGKPRMVLEAKRLVKPLTAPDVIKQIAESDRLLDKFYAVSCNGNIWRLYNVEMKTGRAGFVRKLEKEINLLSGANNNATVLNRLRRRH